MTPSVACPFTGFSPIVILVKILYSKICLDLVHDNTASFGDTASFGIVLEVPCKLVLSFRIIFNTCT